MYHDNNNYVAVLIDDFVSLTARAERINAVQRLVDSGEYVSLNDVYAVLGIEVPKKTEGETK